MSNGKNEVVDDNNIQSSNKLKDIYLKDIAEIYKAINTNSTNFKFHNKGRYGSIYKYVSTNGHSYAIKKHYKKIIPEDNPDDMPFSSIRINYLLNNFIENDICNNILYIYDYLYFKEQVYTISEFADGTLYDLIKNKIIKDKNTLKILLFQIIYCLCCIQEKFPTFKHNDLSLANIFYIKVPIDKEYYYYKFDNKVYKIPNIGYIIKIADFDFSCIPGIIDNNIIPHLDISYNITDSFNQYYDLSFLLYQIYKSFDNYELLRPYLFINILNIKNYSKKTLRPIINKSYLTPKYVLYDMFRTFICNTYIQSITSDFNSHNTIKPDYKILHINNFKVINNTIYLYRKNINTINEENITDVVIHTNYSELKDEIPDYDYKIFENVLLNLESGATSSSNGINDIFLINNFSDYELELFDLILLCDFIHKKMQKDYFIDKINLQILVNTIFCKVIIYFFYIIPFNTVKCYCNNNILYNQIIIDKKLIDEFCLYLISLNLSLDS